MIQPSENTTKLPKNSEPLYTSKKKWHQAVGYKSAQELNTMFYDFIKYGMQHNYPNILVISKEQEQNILPMLKNCNNYIDKLGTDIMLLRHEDILSSPEPLTFLKKSVFDVRQRMPNKKRRIHLLCTLADHLMSERQYKTCLVLESFWDQTVKESDVEFIMVCPHKIPYNHMKYLLEMTHMDGITTTN